MKLPACLCIITLCFAFEWERIGPDGQSIYGDIGIAASNEDIMYVSNGGWPQNHISKTVNSADSWERISTLTTPVCDIEVDPLDPDVVYAVGDENYYLDTLFKSTDGGYTWARYSVAGGDGMAYMLAIHPTNTDTIYAAGYDYDTLNNYYPYFFESHDGGVTWSGKQLDTLEGESYCICLAPSDPEQIFVGGCVRLNHAYEARIYRSFDGGQTWNDTSSNIAAPWIFALACHPSNAAIAYTGSGDAIYRTIDGGDSWTQVATTESIWSFATSLADPAIVYAGNDVHVYKSTDTGATWVETNYHRGKWSYIKVRSNDASHVFVANSSGFFESTNGGADWFASMDGMIGLFVRGIGVPPGAPNIVHTCSYGTYEAKSVDNGDNWEWIGWIDDRVGGSCRSYAFHNQNPDIVFGLTGYG